MNEAETRRSLIDPALHQAGWDEASIRREFVIAPGRVTPDAQERERQKRQADYVLFAGERRVAVVEAKRTMRSVAEGIPQARDYAQRLGVRFAFATNGRDLFAIDLESEQSQGGPLGEHNFPSPGELLERLEAKPEPALVSACRRIPWRAGTRYYQERAVEAALRAIGEGAPRLLLTLATGTGKTRIACQLVQKVCAAKWSLRAPLGERTPRVLFLAHRNNLADQAFEAFDDFKDARFRLESLTEKPPQDRILYFTLYQTLLGTHYDETRYQTVFRPDFFDLVIVDECHYGSSNDECRWRAILDYFTGAVQLGLTATPRCDENGDTYAYFGEPRYVYSLKEGIEDGFLTPFRAKRCRSTLATYRYQEGDLCEGEDAIDPKHEYSPVEIARGLFIPERDRHFAQEICGQIPLDQKAIVFCQDQNHAAFMAQALREEAARRGIEHPADFCARVTSGDGEQGDATLRQFRDSGQERPVILTTSEKLTTGVDACNVRSIVLLREIQSRIAFKQILGRGTRLYDGKYAFTVYDFFNNIERHLQDPNWDGEVVCPKCGEAPCVCPKPERKPAAEPNPCHVCGQTPCVCPKPGLIYVTLGEGHAIHAVWTEDVELDGRMVSLESALRRLMETVVKLGDEAELSSRWADEPLDVLNLLADQGFSQRTLDQLQRALDCEPCDMLDLLRQVAYGCVPLSRADRARRARETLTSLATPEQRAFADFLLKQYEQAGYATLTKDAFVNALNQRYHSLFEGQKALTLSNLPSLNAFRLALLQALYPAQPASAS